MQTYTLHTHTTGFDGRSSVQEMISRAKDLDFDTIGISNHFIVNPDIKRAKMYPYAVRDGYSKIYFDRFKDILPYFIAHYDEIEQAKSKNPDIKILRGMEVDFFSNIKWQKEFQHAISILKPDYIIGSAHFVEYNGKLLNSHDWAAADSDTQNTLLQTYWKNIALAAESGLFDWMAHLDLPKKVGLGREEKWAEFENRAVESIAKSKTAIEINTSFYRSHCYEPYPSNRILGMAKNHDVPVLISDDAHIVDNLGRHFGEATQLIKQFKLKTYSR